LGLAIRLGAYICQSGDIYFLFVAISGWRQLLVRRFVCVTRGHTCLVGARRAASTWRLVQGPPGTSSESKGAECCRAGCSWKPVTQDRRESVVATTAALPPQASDLLDGRSGESTWPGH